MIAPVLAPEEESLAPPVDSERESKEAAADDGNDPLLSNGRGDAPRKPRFGRGAKFAVGVAMALVVLIFLGALIPREDNADDSGPGSTKEDPTPTSVPAFASFTGIWWTNFARVELEDDGEGSVTGTYYPYLAGNPSKSIKGIVDGNSLFGTFDREIVSFVFTRDTDEHAFNGFWIDRQGGSHEWCGRRGTQALQSGCGYSGEYKVRGLPDGLQLRGDSVVLAQTAGAAVLTFDSRLYGRVEVAAPFDGWKLSTAGGTVSVTASGTPARFTIDWGVVDEFGWDSLKGDWQALAPTPGGSGKWCAWRAPAPPPC